VVFELGFWRGVVWGRGRFHRVSRHLGEGVRDSGCDLGLGRVVFGRFFAFFGYFGRGPGAEISGKLE
jgi:hypothetical protein